MSDPKYRYHPYDPRDNPRLYREPYEHPGYRPGYSYQARSLEAQSVSEKQMKEKPSRTLFVRNISYDTREEDLRQLFEQYGPVRKIFNLIRKRGMAFVTFYDMRHADKAKRELQDRVVGDRPIDIHYSLPKEDDGRHFPDEDDEKYTGTLFVSVRGTNEPFTNADLRKHFEQWGDVREVRDCRNSSHQKFVEFWDVRDALKVLEQHQGCKFMNGTLELRMAYQQRPPASKTEQSSRSNKGIQDYGMEQRGPHPSSALPSQVPPSVSYQIPLSPHSLSTTPLNAVPGSIPPSNILNPALLSTFNPQLLSLLSSNLQPSTASLSPSTATVPTMSTGGFTVPLSPVSQTPVPQDNTQDLVNQMQQLLYLIASTQSQNPLGSQSLGQQQQQQQQPLTQPQLQGNQLLQLQQLMALLNPTVTSSIQQPTLSSQPQQQQPPPPPPTQSQPMQPRLPNNM